MVAILGPRRATMARELTKIHEELLHGTLPELLDSCKQRDRIQGEITLVIERGETAPVVAAYPESLRQHLEEEMQKTGLPRNEALKSVAKLRGLTRKEAYNALNTE